MKKAMMLLIVSAVVLYGCATPLPVEDRPKLDKDLPFKTDSFDDVKQSMKGYYFTYMDAAEDKRNKNQVASEVSFYSSIVGLIGGVAESVHTAIAGATVAAGGSLYSDRYRLQVQATNYEMAADAMLCMYLASQDITNTGLTNLTIDDQPAADGAKEIALTGLLTVRNKLYRLQASFQLGQPDIGKLRDALKATADSSAGQKSSNKVQELDAAGLAAEKKAQMLLPDYKNKIDGCVARFTG